MVSDEQLNEWRIQANKIRVIRDADESNDIKGIIVAWDDETIMVRKQNRKVLKLSRSYVYQPIESERINIF